MGTFDGQVAIVTCAVRGIALGIARRLAVGVDVADRATH